ncbi:MAG: AzlC family ABC transporter permease [Rhodospirillaceae bacterium]|nr:AzlC family ABC transporter permease [Rhodospirillaceae bacterium]
MTQPPDSPAPPTPADDPAARRGGVRALRQGVVDALGAPALLLFASYLGFGSLVHGAELSLFAGIASTIATFALPGQIVAVELYATGATLTGIALAVALTNVRLLPMTLALLPRFGKAPRWQLYALAHVIAVTGWVQAMTVLHRMPMADRVPYYAGFAAVLMSSTLAGTVFGFLASDVVPAALSLGLIMVNPIYFLLMLSRNLAVPAHAWAMGFGVVLGPSLHLLSPDWGLLATGLIAGTAGFVIGRRPLRNRNG